MDNRPPVLRTPCGILIFVDQQVWERDSSLSPGRIRRHVFFNQAGSIEPLTVLDLGDGFYMARNEYQEKLFRMFPNGSLREEQV